MSSNPFCWFCGEETDIKPPYSANFYEMIKNNLFYLDDASIQKRTRRQLDKIFSDAGVPMDDFILTGTEIISEDDPFNLDFYEMWRPSICSRCTSSFFQKMKNEIPDYNRNTNIVNPTMSNVWETIRKKRAEAYNIESINEYPYLPDTFQYFCWFCQKPREETIYFQKGMKISEAIDKGLSIMYPLKTTREEMTNFIKRFHFVGNDQRYVNDDIRKLIKEISGVIQFDDGEHYDSLLYQFLQCQIVISDSAILDIYDRQTGGQGILSFW